MHIRRLVSTSLLGDGNGDRHIVLNNVALPDSLNLMLTPDTHMLGYKYRNTSRKDDAMFIRNTNKQTANQEIADRVAQAKVLLAECEQIAAANGLVFQMNSLMSDDAVTEQPDWNDSGCTIDIEDDNSDWTSSDEEEWQSSSFC